MSKLAVFATTAATAVVALSLASATSAEARKHRHHHHHRGVSVVIGAPLVYGGYYYGSPRYGYSPSYYYRGGFGPDCLRWQRYYSRSGKVKWRCVAW